MGITIDYGNWFQKGTFLLFYLTMQESHFLGFLLIHQEIDGLAFVTEFALRIDNLRIDICQIANLLRDFSSNRKLWLCCRDGFLELHVQLDGIAAGLQFAGDHPSADFINQCTQNAAVHGVHPSLIIVMWIPLAYDIVAVLIELQVKPDGIVRTTAKAIVFWIVAPRVDNLLHVCLIFRQRYGFFASLSNPA